MAIHYVIARCRKNMGNHGQVLAGEKWGGGMIFKIKEAFYQLSAIGERTTIVARQLQAKSKESMIAELRP